MLPKHSEPNCSNDVPKPFCLYVCKLIPITMDFMLNETDSAYMISDVEEILSDV